MVDVGKTQASGWEGYDTYTGRFLVALPLHASNKTHALLCSDMADKGLHTVSTHR